METIRMNGSTLVLPPEAMAHIGPDADPSVIATDDTIILKKITAARLSDIAQRVSEDPAMPLDEIAQEVHRDRRSRHARRR